MSKTVLMRAPNGQTKEVPADQVAHYEAMGAVVEPTAGYDVDRDIGRAAKIVTLNRRLSQMNNALRSGGSPERLAKIEADRNRVQAELDKLSDPNTAFGGLGPSRARALLELLPPVAGTVAGALAGGPLGARVGGSLAGPAAAALRTALAVAGAGAGGGGGEAARQAIASRTGIGSPEDGPGMVMAAARNQALAELLGRGLMGASSKVSEALAGDALRVPASVEKARLNPRIPADERLPSAAQIMLRERVAPGRGVVSALRGKGTGSEQANAMLRESLDALDREIEAMRAGGMPSATVNQVVNRASERLAELRRTATEPADLKAIEDFLLRQRNMDIRFDPSGRRLPDARLEPGDLLNRRRGWDEVAQTLYNEESRTGMSPRAATTARLEQATAKALADASRGMLEEGSESFGTGALGGINRRTREMAALQSALFNTEARPTALLPFTNPNAATTNWILTHPWFTSRAALGLTHPAFRPMLPAYMRAPEYYEAGQQLME